MVRGSSSSQKRTSDARRTLTEQIAPLQARLAVRQPDLNAPQIFRSLDPRPVHTSCQGLLARVSFRQAAQSNERRMVAEQQVLQDELGACEAEPSAILHQLRQVAESEKLLVDEVDAIREQAAQMMARLAAAEEESSRLVAERAAVDVRTDEAERRAAKRDVEIHLEKTVQSKLSEQLVVRVRVEMRIKVEGRDRVMIMVKVGVGIGVRVGLRVNDRLTRAAGVLFAVFEGYHREVAPA